MDADIRRVEANPAVVGNVKPVVRRRESESDFAEQLDSADGEAKDESEASDAGGANAGAASDRSVSPPGEDEAGGRIDVVG